MDAVEDPNQPGFWQYPCDSQPSIGFQFGGRNFMMDPQDFVIDQRGNICTGALVGINAPDDNLKEPVFLLGALFMKGFVTIFDLGAPAVGFGRLKATKQQYGAFTVVPPNQRTALGTGPAASLSPTFVRPTQGGTVNVEFADYRVGADNRYHTVQHSNCTRDGFN